MAIYHLHCSIVKRSSGQSTIQKAAYCSGTCLQSARTGSYHNYSRRKDVIYSEISLCKNAPKEFLNRESLWNSVEIFEDSLPSRKSLRLARIFDIALPKELNTKEQITLAHDFIQSNFVDHDMIADWSLHDKKDGNPHIHCMVTLRGITKDGQ